MRRIALAAMVAFLGAAAGFAADNPIKARQDLMDANGDATKPIVPMLKGTAPFNLDVVQKALKVYINTAEKAPALFPPGSDKGKTHALPAIWSNKSDFEARMAKLGTDSKAALVAITDDASFKKNIGAVFKNCGDCHENYRAKEQ